MNQPTSQFEQTLIQNEFGSVTSKRIIYQKNKSWFSGGTREDLPLKHVTSVSLEISRSIVWGLLLVIIGFASLAIVVGIVPLIFGILLLMGSPMVVVNTAGNDKREAKGLPWRKKEAEAFVGALRHQLVQD